MIALSEASVLAESARVDVAGLLDVLGGGYASSRVLKVKKHNLSPGPTRPPARRHTW